MNRRSGSRGLLGRGAGITLLFLLLAGEIAIGGTDVGGSSGYGTFQYRYRACASQDHNWAGTQQHLVHVETDLGKTGHQIGAEIGFSHTADKVMTTPDDGAIASERWLHNARLWAAFRHSIEESPILRLRGRLGGGAAFGPFVDSLAPLEDSLVSRGFGLLGYELFLGQWGIAGFYSRSQLMIPWSHGTESFVVLGGGIAGGDRLPLFTVGMRAAFTYNIFLRPTWAQAGLELGMRGPDSWRVRPLVRAGLIKERDEDLLGFSVQTGIEVRIGTLPSSAGLPDETTLKEIDTGPTEEEVPAP